MIRFTSKVRRGLRQFVDRGLSSHVEEIIRQATAPGVPRDKRLTAPECAELRAAGAWIAQEAAGESDRVTAADVHRIHEESEREDQGRIVAAAEDKQTPMLKRVLAMAGAEEVAA